jgi:hypothetical protein
LTEVSNGVKMNSVLFFQNYLMPLIMDGLDMLVALKKGNVITFSEVDILGGAPLLDIKPYVKHFDNRDKVKNGWVEKHFLRSKILKEREYEFST